MSWKRGKKGFHWGHLGLGKKNALGHGRALWRDRASHDLGFSFFLLEISLSLKMKITHQLLEVSVWLGFESTSLWNLPVFPLKKEMATQSSILAWRISWTGEPGRLGVTESDTTEQFSLTHLHFPLRVWNSLTFLVKFILPSTVIALHLTVKNPTLIRAVFLFYTKWIF